MRCGDCPLALPCFAGRLFENNCQGMICPKCMRFTHVRFRVYQGTITNPNGSKITVEVSARDLYIQPEDREKLDQFHTVLHCPKRILSSEQIEAWERLSANAMTGFIPTTADPEQLQPVTQLPGGDETREPVYLNVVPCAICERHRYSKAAIIELLE